MTQFFAPDNELSSDDEGDSSIIDCINSLDLDRLAILLELNPGAIRANSDCPINFTLEQILSPRDYFDLHEINATTVQTLRQIFSLLLQAERGQSVPENFHAMLERLESARDRDDTATYLSDQDKIDMIEELCNTYGVPVVNAPNF